MMKKFLTSEEAADYLKIDKGELESLVSKKKIPSYKIGGIYTRFKLDDLEHYLRKSPKRSRENPPSPITDRIKDFFCFNDFYIYSSIAIIVILYFIFK